MEAQRLFRQTLGERPYDVAELSMGSHIAAVAGGDRHYVGLPIFLSRSFRHSNLYIRTDRGIASPTDLAGKRIGLVDFQQTAALWLRGLLADDHGVDRTSVDWITAGLHQPVLTDRMAMDLPPGLRVARSPSTLDTLLRAGEIDAVISPTAPRCFADPTVPVARLWPDYRGEELRYWQRSHTFPIMHVVIVRRALVEAHPNLPDALYDAFEEARRLAAADLAQRDFPKLTLPWILHAAHSAHELLRGDPWTYGIDENRTTLETMLLYAHADGLSSSRLSATDLLTFNVFERLTAARYCQSNGRRSPIWSAADPGRSPV